MLSEVTIVVSVTCALSLGDRAVRAFLESEEVGTGLAIWGMILVVGALVCLVMGAAAVLAVERAEVVMRQLLSGMGG